MKLLLGDCLERLKEKEEEYFDLIKNRLDKYKFFV